MSLSPKKSPGFRPYFGSPVDPVPRRALAARLLSSSDRSSGASLSLAAVGLVASAAAGLVSLGLSASSLDPAYRSCCSAPPGLESEDEEAAAQELARIFMRDGDDHVTPGWATDTPPHRANNPHSDNFERARSAALEEALVNLADAENAFHHQHQQQHPAGAASAAAAAGGLVDREVHAPSRRGSSSARGSGDPVP